MRIEGKNRKIYAVAKEKGEVIRLKRHMMPIKLLSLFLAFLIMASLLPVSADAKDDDYSAYTALYLDKGNIIIGDDEIHGYDANGTPVTTPNENGYYITQTDQNTQIANTNKITVTGGSHNIVCDGLNFKPLTGSNVIEIFDGTQNIIFSDVSIIAPHNTNNSILELAPEAELNLTVLGNNSLETTKVGSTIHVPEGAVFTVTDDSTGILNLKNTGSSEAGTSRMGAVIGSRYNETAGTIVINGGTINIDGGDGVAAGIGAGPGRNGCGTIIINGGHISVSAVVAAAIGDGFSSDVKGSVTINGGTIYAKRIARKYSEVNAAAIGANDVSETTVTINGGSIRSETFIGDNIVTSTYVETLTSPRYLAKVRIAGVPNQAVTDIQYNNVHYGSTDVQTDEEGYLYLWLPVGDATVNLSSGEQDYTYTGTVTVDNTTELQVSGGNDEAVQLKQAAIEAFLAIPTYDGANRDAIAAALPAAEEAVAAARTAWSLMDIRGWEGYRRYTDAQALLNLAFPTVTLTILGFEENDTTEEMEPVYYFGPSNCSVPSGSTVAEVVCAALDSAGVEYKYTGRTSQGGGFFLKSVGSQANIGQSGWMYMVDSNTYIDRSMADYPAADESNILLFYSTNGYNGPEFDSSNAGRTPYGEYETFAALKAAANAEQELDLKSSKANAVMEKDWEAISTAISEIRAHTDTVDVTAVGPSGSVLVWQSENPGVVGADGRINPPVEDTPVKLTATLYYGGQTAEKELTVIIGKASGVDVTFCVSGAADSDGIETQTVVLNGLNGAEKYNVLAYAGYGKNVMAIDALYAGLMQLNNTTALVLTERESKDAAIGSLFDLIYAADSGRQWMVQVRNRSGEIVYTGDHTDNVFVSLASGDTVSYRYMAGMNALKAQYESVSHVNGLVYSVESFAAFDSSRTAAKIMLKGNQFEVTQEEADSAYINLKAAYQALSYSFDYFEGGDNSVHQKVLNWLVENPLVYGNANTDTYFSWGMDKTAAPGLIALSLNNMLTDSVIYQLTEVQNKISGARGKVINENLRCVGGDPPIHDQALTNIAMTMCGNDMTYYYNPIAYAGFEFYEYAMDFVMLGHADLIYDSVNAKANRLITLNGPVYYPDYQNRSGSDNVEWESVSGYTSSDSRETISNGLTREFLISTLLDRQHSDGGWTGYLNDSPESRGASASTAYVLMALAPYYYEEIELPASIGLAELKAACDRALDFMQSEYVKADRFSSSTWVTNLSNSQVCLNALMFYGIDPESIINDTGDGMITYTMKTFLSEDGAHFEVPGWGNAEAGKYTARFAEMMEYYKQYLINGRASLHGGKTYQNQQEKIELEQAFFEARWGTLGFDPYVAEVLNSHTWDASENSRGYTKLNDYTTESVTALLYALKTAYSVLVDLDSTTAQVTAAKQSVDDAVANLVPNSPETAVIQQINALKDITPDHPMTTEVAAARAAYDALTEEQKALVENYPALEDAEHWSAIAVGYNTASNVGSYLTNIGNTYAALGETLADDWKVVDMAINCRASDILATDEAMQTFVAASIGRIDPGIMTDYERVLIAVTSLGVDGSDLTKYRSFTDSTGNPVTSLVDAITNFSGRTVVNSMVWGLIALDSGDYEVPTGTTWTREAMIFQLLDWQFEDGSWPMNPGETKTNIDTTAMAIVALTPYVDQVDVKTAVDKAAAYLESLQTDGGNGAFQFGSTPNSNSTAMVILARIALGENPKAAYANGKDPVSALITYFGLTDRSGFGYTDNSRINDMATEQSFRALAAYKALAYGHSTTPYYFGAPTLTGPWTEPESTISLNKNTLSLSVGDSAVLLATVTPSGTTVTWTSSDTSVATVTDGVVTAVSAGTAVITASSGDKAAYCTVTVAGAALPEPGIVPADKINIMTNLASVDSSVTTTAEGDTATLHVEAEKACVVVVKIGESYVRLTAEANGDGYDFNQSGYTAEMEFFVMLKGDANGDGKLNVGDVLKANAHILRKSTLDELYFMAADADGNGWLNVGDILKAIAQILHKMDLEWDV